MVSGNKKIAKDYIEGLDMLASMRLCANLAQYASTTLLRTQTQWGLRPQ